MKSIFDKPTREEIINRIHSVNENAGRQWGKMSVHQMVAHCRLWDEWVLGKNKPKYRQILVGRIFGKMVLKKVTANDEPLGRNTPTTGFLKIKENNYDLVAEKNKWIALVNNYEQYSNPAFIHDFFGKMTQEEIGIMAYKHTDHHLRQFGH